MMALRAPSHTTGTEIHHHDRVLLIGSLCIWAGAMAYGVRFGSLGLAVWVGALIWGLSAAVAWVSRAGKLSQTAMRY